MHKNPSVWDNISSLIALLVLNNMLRLKSWRIRDTVVVKWFGWITNLLQDGLNRK
jgi:hypothetical protein